MTNWVIENPSVVKLGGTATGRVHRPAHIATDPTDAAAFEPGSAGCAAREAANRLKTLRGLAIMSPATLPLMRMSGAFRGSPEPGADVIRDVASMSAPVGRTPLPTK